MRPVYGQVTRSNNVNLVEIGFEWGFFRWEDDNSLTSNLFTLITLLRTHKIHQTYAHINLTPKKKKEKTTKKKIIIIILKN